MHRSERRKRSEENFLFSSKGRKEEKRAPPIKVMIVIAIITSKRVRKDLLRAAFIMIIGLRLNQKLFRLRQVTNLKRLSPTIHNKLIGAFG